MNIKQKTGRDQPYLEQLATIGNGQRDPRLVNDGGVFCPLSLMLSANRHRAPANGVK